MTGKPIYIIGGPTASGKSGIALKLARALLEQKNHSVIINADSQQIYQEIPIITASPSADDLKEFPHELYGILPMHDACSVARWLALAENAINKAHASNQLPILVGGTGMYLRALIYGIATIPEITPHIREQTRNLLDDVGQERFYSLLCERDPITGNKLNKGDTQRILRAWEVLEQTGKPLHEWQKEPQKIFFNENQFSGIFIHPPRTELYARCDKRLVEMIEKEGALDEAKSVMKLNLDPSLPAMKSLGLPQLLEYLENKISIEEATIQAQQQTRRYAKRQVTWFRHQLPLLEETMPSQCDLTTIANNINNS